MMKTVPSKLDFMSVNYTSSNAGGANNSPTARRGNDTSSTQSLRRRHPWALQNYPLR